MKHSKSKDCEHTYAYLNSFYQRGLQINSKDWLETEIMRHYVGAYIGSELDIFEYCPKCGEKLPLKAKWLKFLKRKKEISQITKYDLIFEQD